MDALLQGALAPETDEGKSALVVVGPHDDHAWIDLVPDLLRKHLLSKIPQDGNSYVVRIEWSIGGV